jgi:hypothetical protein
MSQRAGKTGTHQCLLYTLFFLLYTLFFYVGGDSLNLHLTHVRFPSSA